MTKKELLDRCARSGEERILLARVLDKLEQAQSRGVPARTAFLSPAEQASVTGLLSARGPARHLFWGGYPDSERCICLFLAPWQEAEDLVLTMDEHLAAVQARFPEEAGLTHRDILGSLMGLGLERELLGDILLPRPGLCQAAVLRETLPILLSQWEGAGRQRIRLEEIPLSELTPIPPQVKTIRDTVAALRLDAVLAAGFSMSRSKAAALIASGRAAVNHRECLKSDRQVAQGDVISCRGLGKFVVKEVSGQSKKGRTMLILERYL
ncbi:RNA-binding protein [Pseudoflavonifractor sp. 60]|uniref:YlmH family RNA-binding protein n=1 Tax=Pseudoflavonifractor sp. 60 TaxID=2304576 RepID=UPI00136D383C|nr:YlmH/Sll1252 family protein [Pseudoflavonifractor sp. 60]NBI65914.1 RNA-binding protein [Pseudoflavonifractor sp. 60]